MNAQQFLARYPEFNSVGIGYITKILDEVKSRYSGSWLENTDAVGLLTAHKLTCRWEQLAKVAGAASAIAGGQAAQGNTPIESYLRSTVYGAELDAMFVVPGVID